MSKATEDALSSLHGALAKHMATRLASEDISPAEISVIRQFLKDNAVSADPATSDDIKALSTGLPDDLDDGSVVPLYGV